MEASEKLRRGKVRILVVGDALSGKTTLLRNIRDDVVENNNINLNGDSSDGRTTNQRNGIGGNNPTNNNIINTVERTVGCNTDIKVVLHEQKTEFFVELFDIGAHEQFRDDRSTFYRDVNGLIIVHDLSLKNSAISLERWAREVAQKGTFIAPTIQLPHPWVTSTLDPHVVYGFGGLPVPCLIISNKADKAYVLDRKDIAGLKAKTTFDGIWMKMLKKLNSFGFKIQNRANDDNNNILPTNSNNVSSSASSIGGGKGNNMRDTDYVDLVSQQGGSPTLGFRNHSAGAAGAAAGGGRRVEDSYFLDPRVPRGAIDRRPIPRGLRTSALLGRVDQLTFDAFFKEIIDRRYYSNLSINYTSAERIQAAPESANSNLNYRRQQQHNDTSDLV